MREIFHRASLMFIYFIFDIHSHLESIQSRIKNVLQDSLEGALETPSRMSSSSAHRAANFVLRGALIIKNVPKFWKSPKRGGVGISNFLQIQMTEIWS